MATKDVYLPSGNNQQQNHGFGVNTQYSNLNLNQICSTNIESTNQTNISYDNKKHEKALNTVSVDNCFNNESSKLPNPSINWNLNDKNEYSKPSSSFVRRVKWDEIDVKNYSSTTNNSTLSLHITAYENSVEAAAADNSSDNESVKHAHQRDHQLFSAKAQDPFDFPRQQQKQNESSPSPKSNQELMAFKLSQRLLNPENRKQPFFNADFSYKENLYRQLLDNIYLFSATPITYSQMCPLHVYHGNDLNLEWTLLYLRYYSINDFIRQNREHFDNFLEIFVTSKSEITNDVDVVEGKSELVLNYFNKKISQNLSETWKEKFEMDAKRMYRNRWTITFEETKYFEYHNSPEFINGRMSFAKVVNFCHNQLNTDDFIPLQTIQQACEHMYDENFTFLLKIWFPKCSGIQNIMRKIIFEEVDCIFAEPGKNQQQHFFRLYSKYSIDEIKEYLNALKNESKLFFQNLFQQPLYFKDQERERRLQYKKIKYGKNKVTEVFQKDSEFGESDDEVDTRIENQKFFGSIIQNRKNDDKKMFIVENDEENKIKEYEEFVKKYGLSVDAGIERFVPSIERCHEDIDFSKIFESMNIATDIPPTQQTNGTEVLLPRINEIPLSPSLQNSVISYSMDSFLDGYTSAIHDSIETANTTTDHHRKSEKQVLIENYKLLNESDISNLTDDEIYILPKKKVVDGQCFPPIKKISDNDKQYILSTPKFSQHVNEKCIPAPIKFSKAEETVQKPQNRYFKVPQIDAEILESYCKILGIDFTKNAAKNFMKNVKIEQISDESIPTSMGEKSNGFATILLFLTGQSSDSMAAKIKNKINEFLIENMEIWEREYGFHAAEICQIIFSPFLTDTHLICLSDIFQCRFGIYCNRKWKYFGSWKNRDNEIPTFLMSCENNKYAPIFSVEF